MKGLKKGDLVIMHTCGEADLEKYKGKILVCRTDEYMLGDQKVIMLEGQRSCWSVKYLEKINVEQNVNSVPGLRQFVNGAIYDHERLVLSYEQADAIITDYEKRETEWNKTLNDLYKENTDMANELAKMIADMKKIYDLSARNGISEKLDDCFYIARKYVEGVFN